MAVAVVILSAAVWQVAHRTSPLVRRWRPTSFKRRTAGPLSVRDSGPPDVPDAEVVVLLHGLGATGAYFGDFYDGLARQRRVVLVDLLGFGHSIDEQRTKFGVDAHVKALDDAVVALDLDDTRVVLAAHSMSAAVALTWADRNRDRTEHLYLWAPPIYQNPADARNAAKQYGLMTRLFLLDTKWAERACHLSCTNRELSGWMMALAGPKWPTAVSRSASEHTWEAYHLSLRNLVIDFRWARALPASAPVTIFRGSDDPIGDAPYTATIAGSATIIVVPGGDHHLPVQHPELLLDALLTG